MTLEDVSEEDLGKHLDQVLRSALGNNVQDLNIGNFCPFCTTFRIFMFTLALGNNVQDLNIDNFCPY